MIASLPRPAWLRIGTVPYALAFFAFLFTLPALKPALVGAAAISLPMSFENFSATLILAGSDPPLAVMMYGCMREGATRCSMRPAFFDARFRRPCAGAAAQNGSP